MKDHLPTPQSAVSEENHSSKAIQSFVQIKDHMEVIEVFVLSLRSMVRKNVGKIFRDERF